MAEIFIFILVVVGAFVILGVFAAFQIAMEKWAISRKKRKLKQLLNGQSLEEVLKNAPYKYGHSQGDSLYRGWDERRGVEILRWFPTTLDAQLWVVETYLSEQNKKD